MPNMLFGVKMRASRAGAHISGAERIVRAEQVPQVTESLTRRAMTHPHGQPDEVHVSVHQIDPGEIAYVRALGVETHPGPECLPQLLADVPARDAALSLARSVTGLRGAMLVDASSGQRLEPDPQRGVRVTNIDWEAGGTRGPAKDHFSEALALASKVANTPGIVAEICISDDPDYTTGYVATGGVYHRVHHMKEPGSEIGTRVFLVRPGTDLGRLMDFLERQAVLVR